MHQIKKMSRIPGFGWSQSVFQVGKGNSKTLAIPFQVHESNRLKLIELFRSKHAIHNGIILLKGGEESYQYDTDSENIFKQDSWFNYLFGVKEPNFFGVIRINTGEATLFVPRLPEDYAIWCGEIYSNKYFQQMYAVNEVLYVDEMYDWIRNTLAEEDINSSLHLLEGINSDSGSKYNMIYLEEIKDLYSNERVSTHYLYDLLATCRTIKNQMEIEILRYTNYVASNAHVATMRIAKNCQFEYNLEANFLYEIYNNGGCRNASYTSICACGPNGAVLHYGHAAAPNDRELSPGNLALLDMGASYHGYASDITCTFPISGNFSEDQKVIYQGVLNAQVAVMHIAQPGESWVRCHHVAQIEIIKSLIDVGILIGGTAEELAAKQLGAVFFPHGLGHLIGCDTHDVGGYISGTPVRPSEPGFRKLRTARNLEEGFVLTNEPGCYFIDVLLDKALADPDQSIHINNDILKRFRGFGGVRLEDDIVITKNGADNLTLCPRTINEIESVMNGGLWPPAIDTAPQLRRRWVKLSANGIKMESIELN